MEVLVTAVALPTKGCLLQNLGPDTLYLGEPTVVAGSGVSVLINEAAVIGASNRPIYAVSDGTSDVRLLGRGTGMFSSG